MSGAERGDRAPWWCGAPTGRWWPPGCRSTCPPPCSTATGWWPARRRPGPRGSSATCAGATPRPAAPSWWCWRTTRRARPGPSSRSPPPSRRSPPASRSPTRGPAPSPPGARPATTAATRRWPSWPTAVASEALAGRVARAGGRRRRSLRRRRWPPAAGRRARDAAPWRPSAARCRGGRPPGDSPAFLAPVPVTVLAEPGGPAGPDLVDVLERLGLRTLGALAALPVAEVVGRFGAEGLAAHRLARGLDERPPVTAPRPRSGPCPPRSTRPPSGSRPPPSWPAAWSTTCRPAWPPGAAPAPGW